MLSWTTSTVLKQLLECMKSTSGDGDALIEMLSQLEVDINAYDSSGFTLMHHAASLGYDDCIYALFRSGANLEQYTIDNRSTEAVANDSGFPNTASFIKSLIEEETGFLSSISNNDVGYIKSHIRNPDCKFYRTSSGLLPLHFACQVGAQDVVTELLDGGFDINQKDIYGRTPLHWSALLLDLPLFLFLIEKGADYHIRSHTGKTPISMAFSLLKVYDQPDFSVLCDEAFLDAVRRMDMESCETFIECRGSDYIHSLVNADGNTALHIAVLDNGSTDINDIILQVTLIRLLLSKGMDVNAVNKKGQSVIDLAKLNAHSQILAVVEPPPFMELSPIRTELSRENSNEGQLKIEQVSEGSEGSQEEEMQENYEKQTEPLSALSPSSSITSLLISTGLQEYQPVFDESGYHICSDLFSLTEKDLVNMKLKFGHRKFLVDVLRRLDILSSFLEDAELTEHKEELQKMGFETEWSILGVNAEYAEKMGLTEEEMQRWLEQQKKLTVPELPTVDKNDKCEPILRLIFNEEDVQAIISQAALTSVSILMYIDMNSQDELKIRFGEIVGLCYIIKKLEQQLKGK